MAFHIVDLGGYTGVKAAAKATNCTVSQFEYRWYKLGLRTKHQFYLANNPQLRKQNKSEISLINRALKNWSRPLCADQKLSF